MNYENELSTHPELNPENWLERLKWLGINVEKVVQDKN